jgi:hypothetical protein
LAEGRGKKKGKMLDIHFKKGLSMKSFLVTFQRLLANNELWQDILSVIRGESTESRVMKLIFIDMRKESWGLILLCLINFSIEAQFKNIKLAEQVDGAYPPLEPSIAINHRDANNIVAGVVLDRAIYTKDGGLTWKESKLTSPFGVYGDPAVISDSKGDMYYFHLSDASGKGRSHDEWLDRIVCQRSEDGGATWDEGESIGLNSPKDQDKPWPAVHPRKQNLYVTWTQFDKYGVKDSTCHSNILFSMSTSAGKKWSKPVQINQYSGDCVDDDNTTEGAVPAVSEDGKVYIAWANKEIIYFDRSFDGGQLWLSNDLALTRQVGGWSMDIPGINRCNGMPLLMIDNSRGSYHGSLYIVWADQRNGVDDTDIWMIRSINKGDNWTEPQRINQDGPGKHQFLPWMAIDQTTGYVYVVYYDRRNYDDNQTDVYVASSSDGGNHFTEKKISETPFVPSEKKFFGDYNNISAHKGIVAPIWTRMDSERTSVWTAIIKEAELIKK